VDVPVLLRDLRLVRQMDLDEARLDHRKLRADQRHRVLQVEAGADTGGVVGVLGLELRHFRAHGRCLRGCIYCCDGIFVVFTFTST